MRNSPSTEEIVLMVVLAILNSPLFFFMFRKIFGSLENFADALKDAFSEAVTRGGSSFNEAYNNAMAYVLVLLFIGACAGLVAGEYYVIWCVFLSHSPFWK